LRGFGCVYLLLATAVAESGRCADACPANKRSPMKIKGFLIPESMLHNKSVPE
jgi:hypothetical protein